MSENIRVNQDSSGDHISQAEIYAYYFQNPDPEPACYSRIPDIIHHLTYTHPESGETCRLSVHAKMLYCVIKQITGDDGKSWKSAKSLAYQCNMSEGMIAKCKKELTMPFHQLDGNSLLTIEIKQKAIMEKGQCIGKSTYHNCSLVNIWRWNIAFMRSKAYQVENVHNTEAESPHDSPPPAESPHDSAPQGAQSPGDSNNTPYNNTSMSIKQHSPASPDSVCSLDKKERLFPSDRHQKIYNWLLNGLPPDEQPKEPLAYKIATGFNPVDVGNAADYIKARMAKYKEKHGQQMEFSKGYVAYLQDVINNRYWEKK